MKVLGIETSCDETAVAIVEGRQILSSVVASQHDIHAKYGGIVPELASRRHVEVIGAILREALDQSRCLLSDIGGVAVTFAPGLIGALLTGLSTAKAISYALRIPLVGVNHLEGHLNAIHLAERDVPYPHIGLVVSGGHTSLYLVEEFGRYRFLGATRDDAAGEAFDKAARLMGLGYPGGPIIDRLARLGDPTKIQFKPPKFRRLRGFDFSFSGIKTALMFKYSEMKSGNSQNGLYDLIASFQMAIVRNLVDTTMEAASKHNSKAVVVSGGVASNSALREEFGKIGEKMGICVLIPPPHLCTDNAAMIAYVGGRYLEMGRQSDLSLNAFAVQEIGMSQ